MAEDKIANFGSPKSPWAIPTADLARQATAPLRGYVYQIHQSAAAWLALQDDDLLHLEVAEDFSEIIKTPDKIDEFLRATQVKDTRESGAVTLNSSDVLDAINALFRLQTENPNREVRLTFLTTSEIGRERLKPLPTGRPGLDEWQIAGNGGDVEEIRTALIARIDSGKLAKFIRQSSADVLRQRLLSALTFVCGARDWKDVEAANRARLIELRDEVKATADMADRAYDAVFHQIITTALSSETRMLDRSQLLACLRKATSIALPSQAFEDYFTDPAVRTTRSAVQLDLTDLRLLAQELLDVGSPPSISRLFPDASETSRAALEAITNTERFVIDTNPAAQNSSKRLTILELSGLSAKKHLVVGPPGSGKTHALWQMANRLLRERSLIPIFLPVGHLVLWDQIRSIISDVRPGIDAEAVFRDTRVCICIDGWSEFATGSHIVEKTKTLRKLRGAHVIANARKADVGDTAVNVWALEPLSQSLVTSTVEMSNPGGAPISDELLELLQLPLLLSLFVLSGGKATATGELLRQFHDHLTRGLPEGFSEALSGAVAAATLADDRSFGRLVSELQSRASARNIPEPINLLTRLGSIADRCGQVLPVHDLYWSWLCGCGLLAEGRTADAVNSLRTRESYRLAFQSGRRASPVFIAEAANSDLVLAADFDASIGSRGVPASLSACLELGLSDARLAVKYRAALACLHSRRPEYISRALSVLSELAKAHIYQSEWKLALRPKHLFAQRGALADWLGSEGSEIVLDSIAYEGGPEWLPWLEMMAASRKITFVAALAAALACSPTVPLWGLPHLDSLFKSAWVLRATSVRRANVALARLIAKDYERLIDSVTDHGSSAWTAINRVLVACGGDDAFASLLSRFGSMSTRSQELLGFAVVERGGVWIARFQRIAFAEAGGQHHHKLASTVSTDIDDETARKWIAQGHEKIGWRVLIARHGETLFPELLAGLPPSFADLHYIPSLAAMRYLESAPQQLVDELWTRVKSPMQPMAMQDLLCALAKAKPVGMASIVRYILQQPDALPVYHLAQSLSLYEEWRKEVGAEIRINTASGEVPFPNWIARHSAVKNWHADFTPAMLASLPDLAVDLVVDQFRADDEKSFEILSALKGVRLYRSDLLDRMMAAPKLTPLIPEVFADSFDLVPPDALHRMLASSDIDEEKLLFRLSTSSNPSHGTIHAELIKRILGRKMSIDHYRYLANMLKAHTRHDVVEILAKTTRAGEDNSIWFIREVELAREERLVNEDGGLLR